jgi:hypothetical protein
MPKNELKTILCPVDFNDLSAYALRYAKELGKCNRASGIVALHAAWWEAPVYFSHLAWPNCKRNSARL